MAAQVRPPAHLGSPGYWPSPRPGSCRQYRPAGQDQGVRLEQFFRVLGWALLAYLVIAGILEFVFVYDRTPGRQLALFTVLLSLFATDVPVLLAFSVARYQPVPT